MDIQKLSKQDCANLRSEIKLHQGLHHPHIIGFIDCLQVDHLVYILLEYASNGSLFPYINRLMGLPEKLALRFLYQTALGVQYLHQNQIVHRDLKPENLLLDDGFNIKVADFGWSCFLEGDQVRTTICGTYEYMPPEIVNEQHHTSKVDMWCLGVLLYEMLHGKSPFQGNSLAQLKDQINSTRNIAIRPEISPDTQKLIRQLLSTESSQRLDIVGLIEHPALVQNIAHFKGPISTEDFDILLTNFYESKYRFKAPPLPQQQQPLLLNGPFVNLKLRDETGQLKLLKIPVPENIRSIEEKVRLIASFNRDEFRIAKRSNSTGVLNKISSLENKRHNYELKVFAQENYLASSIIRNAIQGRFAFHPSGRIIVFERKFDWLRDFYKIEKDMELEGAIWFIIYFDSVLSLYIVEVVPYQNEKGIVRKLIKKDYRGRRDKELYQLTNLSDFKFCHAAGVIAGTGSLNTAILAADLSL